MAPSDSRDRRLGAEPSTTLEDQGSPAQMLVFAVVALVGLGLVMAASIDGPVRGFWPALSTRAARVLIGLGACFLAYRVNLSKARELVLPLYVSAVFLCLVPRLLGQEANGAYRWIHIGPFSLQPVEIVKVASIFATVELLERRRPLLDRFAQGLLPVVCVPLSAAAVLVSQPDIGHAFFVVAVCGILILCGGARLHHSALLAAAAGVVLWVVLNGMSHSQSRLAEFASGEPGHQMSRSLAAFAEGGLAGQGIGAGWIKMGYLPEARNDFVLAIIGNELGLPGSLAVVGLFALFFVAALRIALGAEDRWRILVAMGLTVTLVVQASVNVLGVTFTIPEKGIDLPFLSSGGTNLVFALASVGILLNVARAGSDVWSKTMDGMPEEPIS